MPLGTPADPGSFASVGFESLPTEPHPSYVPNDTIIPTFDDVPSGPVSPPDPTYGTGSWTKLDLELLDGFNMHADFFINTNNWCGDVTASSECTADIGDILAKHYPANHTVYHPHMGATNTAGAKPNGCDNATDCEAELSGVESVINTMSNGSIPHLTRFRFPYGEPQQSQSLCAAPSTCAAMTEGVVAKYAVSVGWNFDSGDSDGTVYTGATLASKVEGELGGGPGQGSWGVILMHGVYPWTHDAIPLLFDPNTGYLATHGFKTATVEDAICWKYGMHSWEIVTKITGQPRSPN